MQTPSEAYWLPGFELSRKVVFLVFLGPTASQKPSEAYWLPGFELSRKVVFLGPTASLKPFSSRSRRRFLNIGASEHQVIPESYIDTEKLIALLDSLGLRFFRRDLSKAFSDILPKHTHWAIACLKARARFQPTKSVD
jgi:hypothetical protein